MVARVVDEKTRHFGAYSETESTVESLPDMFIPRCANCASFHRNSERLVGGFIVFLLVSLLFIGIFVSIATASEPNAALYGIIGVQVAMVVGFYMWKRSYAKRGRALSEFEQHPAVQNVPEGFYPSVKN